MKVKIYKNFLNLEECDQLNQIALNGIDEGWIGPGISRREFGYDKRYTSRLHMDSEAYPNYTKNNVKYPEFVLEISDKIRKFMKIDHYPIISGHGRDGVVVSVTFKGGDVYSHKDPRSKDGWTTYRCNVLTQATEEGAELYVDNKLVNINVGDLHCYYASEQIHYVTEVKGTTSRILWMFGCHRPYEDFITEVF